MSRAVTEALPVGSLMARKPRVRPQYGPGSSGLLMTNEQFDASWPEQFRGGYRYELINEVLVVSPPAGTGERMANDFLGYFIFQYRETSPDTSVIDDTGSEQIVPATNRRRADRVIWTGLGRVPNAEADIPSIVIEFVSKRRRDFIRDYETKRDEYLAAGVKEYWVIDRFRRIMTVYRQGPIGPISIVVPEFETYQTDLLPGFVLPLPRLLARADEWKPPRKPLQPKRSPEPNPPAGASDG